MTFYCAHLSRFSLAVFAAGLFLLLPATEASSSARYEFSYADRSDLLAAGWDYLAKTRSGSTRNTEQLSGAAVSYDQAAHSGKLRIPADIGDLWAGLNSTRNTLFRTLPPDWTSIRLKLDFNPVRNYQQAGLLAYQDDDNYVQITRIYENGPSVTFVRETNGTAQVVKKMTETATGNLHLRLDRAPGTDTYTASYSLNGTTWTSLGSVSQALADPRLAIVVGASPDGFPNADISWAEVITESVESAEAALSLSPGVLVFRTTGGAANPPSRSVTVLEDGPGSLLWNVNDNASWLAVSPSSGAGSGNLSVSVNANGLAPGVYTGTVTLTAPAAVSEPQSVTTVLIVNPAVPVMVADWKGGRRGAVSVSVDDSQGSCFNELSRNGFKGTYFLNGLLPSSLFSAYVNAGMELGSHLTYHACTEVPAALLRSQYIENSIQAICSRTPQRCEDVISLAWPCGYTSAAERFVSADYFMSARGYNFNLLESTVPEDPQNLKTFNSHEHTPYPPSDLKKAVDAAEQQGKWANLVFHTLCNDDGAIDYAATRDVWVAPIGTVVKYLLQAERVVLTGYQETAEKIIFSVSRLSLPASSARSFETAIRAADTLTLIVDVDDSRPVAYLRRDGVPQTYELKSTNGNKVLLLDIAVNTAVSTIEIAYGGAAEPVIAVKPGTLEFAAEQGSNPDSGLLYLENSGGGSLVWSAAADGVSAAWLSVSPASGTGNDAIRVSVNSAGFAPGTYAGRITIAAPGAANSPQTVTITLAVQPGGASRYQLGYSGRSDLLAAGWDFFAKTRSGSTRNTEQLSGAVVSFDQAAHPGKLRIPADSGDLWAGLNNTRNTLLRTLPGNWTSIRLKLDFGPVRNYQQAGLAAYQDDDNYVQITRIYENGQSMTFARETNGSAQIVKAITETATGGLHLRLDRAPGTDTFTAYYSLNGTSWTSLGSVSQALVNPRLAIVVGASPGGFPNADLSWAEVLTTAAEPTIVLSPASLVFTAAAGSVPPDRTLALSFDESGVTSWTAVVAPPAPAWLRLTPTSGAGPSEMTVSVNPAGLEPGTYRSSIVIAAAGASVSRSADVTLVVKASDTSHFDFTYTDRAAFLSGGWDFVALSPSGALRNTEQTTGVVPSFDQAVHSGRLRIPADIGDLWASLNNTRNSLFRDLPENWTSIRMKLDFAPTRNYQQAGLVAYQDDNNYVQVTRIYENGNRVTFARETSGSPVNLYSSGVTAVKNIHLRLDRDPAAERLTGYYSLDGTAWISLGQTVQSLVHPRLGIIVGASPAGLPDADIAWVEITAGVAGE